MKRKKKIHSGVCITDEHIVCVTAHIENKTMVITDALEMKRTGPIDEDVTKFIETYDLDEGAYSIVANIDTQMHVAPYDPHDFDMKEFIKWNIEDYFSFDGDSFQMDACRREYPRHNYHMFMVAVDRHSLELLKQGIRDTYAPVDVIDLCIQECIVPITGSDVAEAMDKLEVRLQDFGIDEIQGIRMYGLESITNEERTDMEGIISMYGETEYIPLLFLGRGRNRCKQGQLDWDMAIGMAARGLKWIGLGW